MMDKVKKSAFLASFIRTRWTQLSYTLILLHLSYIHFVLKKLQFGFLAFSMITIKIKNKIVTLCSIM